MLCIKCQLSFYNKLLNDIPVDKILCFTCAVKEVDAQTQLLTQEQTKIQTLQQKIQAYQVKYHKRDDEQKHYLSCLWLELAFWQLVQEGKVKPHPL